MRKERINEIWGVLFLLLGLFTLAALFFYEPEDISFFTSNPYSPVKNYTGVTGAHVAFGLLLTFGASAYLLPGLFLLWAGCFFTQRVPEKKIYKYMGLTVALFSTSTLIALSADEATRFNQAGVVGYIAGNHLLRYFGVVGSHILAGSSLLLSLLLATDFLIYPLIRGTLTRIRNAFQSFFSGIAVIRHEASSLFQGLKPKAKEKKEKKEGAFLPPVLKGALPKTTDSSELPDFPLKVKKYRPDLPDEETEAGDKNQPKKKEAGKSDVPMKAAPVPVPIPPAAFRQRPSSEDEDEGHHDGVISSKPVRQIPFELPAIDLLNKPQPSAAGKSDDLQGNSRILEETLSRFGIAVKVVEVEQGPVITRYELMPAPGVKVNSIVTLADDIALALKAASVRLIVPIPGKSAIGIEVPNSVSSIVSLRELVDSHVFKSRKFELPLVLGKDTSGKTLIADLTHMPHILIAGTTGSGKSVCMNSIITGLLYYCTPDQLKLVMIDPKMVELAVYNKVPHMLTPVVTNVKKAAHTLHWVVNEMENRYKLLANIGVRNIQAFNSRPLSDEARGEIANKESENVVPEKLPYIVVIIDELADLMMQAQDKVEGPIARIAQLARAVGIHLIIATQRPSVDVITGVIKANFPARISFKVSSKVDSRTVLDANGADKLLGKGDMLFLKPGMEKLIRGQAPFVIDEEINAVVHHWANQANPEFHAEIAAVQEGKSGMPGGAQEKDELFDEAVAVILETGQASTSNLQRRLRLGYTRAARIIDQMEAEGLIGPTQGAKPRDIYVGREDMAAAEQRNPV